MSGRRGQHLAQYALLIGAVTAALLTMQTFVRRGLQARIATGAMIGRSTPAQYEPYYLRAPAPANVDSRNNTTRESGSMSRTAAFYRVRPDRVTGQATLEVTPREVRPGVNSYQREWPALP